MSSLSSKVSVVILTFNRRQEVLSTLGRLSLSTPNTQFIVVDNGSQDGTAQAVRDSFPGVLLIEAAHNLGAAARNLGVKAAQTPYVAFCDDDTCWEPGAVDLAVSLLEQNANIAVVCARIQVGEEGRPDPACDAMEHSPLGRLPQGKLLLGFMAGACVMRRCCFLSVGGYWKHFFIGGEESLMALDFAVNEWHMVYAAEVLTRHYPSLQRDAPARRDLLSRNAVWTAWMRLPLSDALLATAQAVVACRSASARWRLLVSAVAGLPRALSKRRPIPLRVQALRRRLRQAGLR